MYNLNTNRLEKYILQYLLSERHSLLQFLVIIIMYVDKSKFKIWGGGAKSMKIFTASILNV